MTISGTIVSSEAIVYVLLALALAAVVAFVSTPLVKVLSVKFGAVDIPKDNRRMHDHPIPRMGGLAIFFGFLVSMLLFVQLNDAKKGMLLGAVIIVVLGVLDDKYALPAIPKFLVQIAAALIAVQAGNKITVLSNPNIFSSNPIWELGILSVPITVIWIVAITNSVNFIDGLDGLACGVSTIGAATMLVIALLVKVSEQDVAVMMAALVGACIGFLPYNLNPAKIFMGDTGSTFLGFIMATVSVNGMFKQYTIISFVVPFLMLGLPIFDECFAVIRRLSRGQSPMAPDRGHVHHRLIDMGFSQKQAVGVLYVISAILGLSAVVLTAGGAEKAIIFLLAMGVAVAVAWRLFLSNAPHDRQDADDAEPEGSEEEKDG